MTIPDETATIDVSQASCSSSLASRQHRPDDSCAAFARQSSTTLVNSPSYSSEERYEARERYRRLKMDVFRATQEVNRTKLVAWSSSSAVRLPLSPLSHDLSSPLAHPKPLIDVLSSLKKAKHAAAEDEVARLQTEAAEAEARMDEMHQPTEVTDRERASMPARGVLSTALFDVVGITAALLDVVGEVVGSALSAVTF
jgi:hypothetical protein